MAGRPKGAHTRYKNRKAFHEPGRYKERLDKLYNKKLKLEMLNSLILTHEQQPKPNYDEIRELKRRANEVRNQLAVMSTIEPLERK